MKKLLYIIPILLLLFGFGIGNPDPTVYYVNTAADAGGDGTTQELTGEHCAFKTIAQVNAASPAAGDSVLFNKGNEWREKLTVPTSGSDGLPITFGAYGNGADPIINGANLIIGWTNYNGNIWYLALTTQPNQIFFDGTYGDKKNSLGALTYEYDWFWDSSVLYCYAATDPDDRYVAVEASARDLGIWIKNKDYITVQDLTIKYSNQYCITLQKWDGNAHTTFVIDNCDLSYSWRHGILLYNAGANSIAYVTISDCTIHHNRACGIASSGEDPWVNNITIQDNTIHHNCMTGGTSPQHADTAGIRILGTVDGGHNNVTIIGNTIYSNGENSGLDGNHGLGIWIDHGGTAPVISRNLVYSNNSHGICFEIVDGGKIYYNISHSNTANGGVGILVSRRCHDNEVYNNVSYGNYYGFGVRGDPELVANNETGNILKNNISGGSTARKELLAIRGGENDGTYGSGNVYTYNCFGAEASNFIEWGEDTYKSTYDAWETAYGGSTHSVKSDPLMTDPANDNFKLNPHSPCVNAGTDVSLTEDYEGLKIRHAPDIGAHENQANVLFFSWFLRDFLGVNK